MRDDIGDIGRYISRLALADFLSVTSPMPSILIIFIRPTAQNVDVACELQLLDLKVVV